LRVMRNTNWRVRGKGGAAEILGLKPTTLEARMKKLGIARPQDHVKYPTGNFRSGSQRQIALVK